MSMAAWRWFRYMKTKTSQKSVYLLASYVGLLPFWIFLIGCLYAWNDPPLKDIFIELQFGYALVIISFLSATYWQQAVLEKSLSKILMCLLPIFSLIPLIYISIKVSYVLALFFSILFFWLLLFFDKVYGNKVEWFQGYFLHRFTLTILVSVILIATAWIGAS